MIIIFNFGNLRLSNISSTYFNIMVKKMSKKISKKEEDEKEKKAVEHEEMKEESHQLELKSQYEVDEEDEGLMD